MWGYAMARGDRSVDVFVRKLRQKLERSSPEWRYLHTHFGVGYRFAAEPATESELPPLAEDVVAAPPEPAVDLGVDEPAPRPRPDAVAAWRNIAIVLAVALAVLVLPGGGDAADLVAAILGLIFAAGIALFVGKLYRENRIGIFALGDRYRGLLYGSLAVAAATVTASSRLWESGVGTFLWFVLVGGASYGLVVVVQHARRYA